MDLRDSYARQVRLLMTALPHVAKESCFALKGGTAINLFVQDFLACRWISIWRIRPMRIAIPIWL
jgi:hypothetical protein